MNADEGKRFQFESLVVEHHVRVRAFVRSLGVDPDWVDDLSQEVFLTAYREWDSFDQTRDFGKWLRGIAANLVRNEIRKDARRRRILRTELTEILLNRSSETRDSDESLTIGAIRECLGKLTPASRALVQGRYRDGETATELADRFKLTSANVRQMLVRIRRQIKRCVELQMVREA